MNYKKEDIKNIHYNHQNQIQFEYGGQTHHYSMDCLKDHFVKCWNLIEENIQLKEKAEYLKSKIENKDRWCQLIADIGYDYDGFNQVDSLKTLIDELVQYALYSRDNDDYLEWEKRGHGINE